MYLIKDGKERRFHSEIFGSCVVSYAGSIYTKRDRIEALLGIVKAPFVIIYLADGGDASLPDWLPVGCVVRRSLTSGSVTPHAIPESTYRAVNLSRRFIPMITQQCSFS